MPQTDPNSSNWFTKGVLAISRLLTAVFLFIKTMCIGALDSLDNLAEDLLKRYKIWRANSKEAAAKRRKVYLNWKKTTWEKSYKPFLLDKSKFLYELFVLVIVYGLLVNYMATIFFGYDFNLKTLFAFGIAVYFLKVELSAWIIKIRGPKMPPIMMP
jgi:hypothetical protein